MKGPEQILLRAARDRTLAALELLDASVSGFIPFDPKRNYAPKESEPYDAMCDRFLRAFESAVRFFRTYERVVEAAPSETFRDLLNRMEKLGFISAAGLWLRMRDTRNRIAHEYLPEELAKIYQAIVTDFSLEFKQLAGRLSRLDVTAR